jgi:hypothetical protein
MKHRDWIADYYVDQNCTLKTDGLDEISVRAVVGQIIDQMEEMDMPEQEIISILLPVDHPLNGPGGKQENR